MRKNGRDWQTEGYVTEGDRGVRSEREKEHKEEVNRKAHVCECEEEEEKG